jgi:hypothetical protein
MGSSAVNVDDGDKNGARRSDVVESVRLKSGWITAIAVASILVAVTCFFTVFAQRRDPGPVPWQRTAYAIVASLMVANFVIGLRARGRSKWVAYLAATICLFAIWPLTVETLLWRFWSRPLLRR